MFTVGENIEYTSFLLQATVCLKWITNTPLIKRRCSRPHRGYFLRGYYEGSLGLFMKMGEFYFYKHEDTYSKKSLLTALIILGSGYLIAN